MIGYRKSDDNEGVSAPCFSPVPNNFRRSCLIASHGPFHCGKIMDLDNPPALDYTDSHLKPNYTGIARYYSRFYFQKNMPRSSAFYVGLTLVGLLFLFRLFQIQVVNDDYAARAERNATAAEKLYAPRGYIYDRDGRLLVGNSPAYDLMVSPYLVKDLDTAALGPTPRFWRFQTSRKRIEKG